MTNLNLFLPIPVGVDMVHCAVLETDGKNVAPVYGNLTLLNGVKTMNLTYQDNKTTEYFDNIPMYTVLAKGPKAVTFSRSSINNAEKQLLFGQKITVDGYVFEDDECIAPYIALGYRRLKLGTDGRNYYDYVWLLKGVLSQSNDNVETKGEKISVQPRELSGEFINRICDNASFMQKSTDDAGVSSVDLEANFFTLATLNQLLISV